MKIVVLAYTDADVSEGISTLIHQYPEAGIILPVTGFAKVVTTVIDSAEAHDVSTTLLTGTCQEVKDVYLGDPDVKLLNTGAEVQIAAPHAEAIRRIDHGDAVAFVWSAEEIDAVDRDRKYLEDYGITQWDITAGASPMDGPIAEESENTELQEAIITAFAEVGERIAVYVDFLVGQALEQRMSGDNDA